MEAILKGMQGGGGATPPPDLQKIAQGAGSTAATTATDAANNAKDSVLDRLVQEDEKRKQEAAALAANAGQKNLNVPNVPTDEDLKKMLSKQTELAQGAVGDKSKEISGAIDQRLGNTPNPNSGGAVVPAMGSDFGNSGKVGVIPTMTGANTNPPPVLNAGMGQTRIPNMGTDGYPGQADAAAINAGSRTIQPVSLGSPAMTPPNNQFAMGNNAGAAPSNPEPRFVSQPEARVQPMTVSAPSTPAPALKDHWDDDLYIGQAGDSFKRISSDKYGSDRYAQALMFYNRDHVLASDATRHDPSTIVSNQRIFIPPARILQREYESVIPTESEAAANRTAPPPARPTTPGVSPAAGLPEKSYRVRGSGEMFLTIARNTLGDESRWPEIYNLNKRFEPTVEVPGGSVLRMPGDAKIDAADAAK